MSLSVAVPAVRPLAPPPTPAPTPAPTSSAPMQVTIGPAVILPSNTSSPIGPLAWLVEAAPVQSLTGAGALVGGVLGALAGYVGGSLLHSKQKEKWALGAAALGAIALGIEGYGEGQELAQWLQEHESSGGANG